MRKAKYHRLPSKETQPKDGREDRNKSSKPIHLTSIVRKMSFHGLFSQALFELGNFPW
jgi:hypothetical protein